VRLQTRGHNSVKSQPIFIFFISSGCEAYIYTRAHVFNDEFPLHLAEEEENNFLTLRLMEGRITALRVLFTSSSRSLSKNCHQNIKTSVTIDHIFYQTTAVEFIIEPA